MRRRDHFEWVVIRLEYWGRWMSDGGQGLGYPGRTNEGRLMDDGQIGLVTNYRDHSPQIEFAHKEQETDRAIQGLPADWRYIIYRMYADQKKPLEMKRQHGWSEGWIRRKHDEAIAFLAGAIGNEISARNYGKKRSRTPMPARH